MLGDKIKQIRKDKKISQKEFAEILEIPVSTLANYENNHREPNMETLKKISKALDISPTEFFDWEHLDEKDTHKLISEITGDGDSFGQIESKISYSLLSIFEFISDLYGDDFLIINGQNFIGSEDYSELFMNVTDLIENKLHKLISLKKIQNNE